MSNKTLIKSIVVLTVICLVISGALAVVNSFTAPIIEAAAIERETASRQQVLPAAGLLLRQRKLQVEEILARLAGQRLPENLTVLLQRRLLERQEGLPQLRDDLAVLIYIATPDPVDPAVVHGHQFADLRNCFFVQKILLL